MGTNAEVVVGNENWLIACAGAAGPALEGGMTEMGMVAGPGVVDRIAIDPDTHEFDLHTIDGEPPKGICGSGIIDLAAALFLSEMIDIRGKFVPAACGSHLKQIDGLAHLVVVPADKSATGSDLTISQADLDSLIRSKAAMYTILETITASVGMSLKELTSFFVGGTFGSFIDPRAAIAIGMLPDLPLDSLQTAGKQLPGRCRPGAHLGRFSGRNRRHPRPHHLPGVKRQPGIHEPLQRCEISAAYQCILVSFRYKRSWMRTGPLVFAVRLLLSFYNYCS